MDDNQNSCTATAVMIYLPATFHIALDQYNRRGQTASLSGILV